MTVTQPALHKFTADEYQRMGEVGILCEGDRVELIEGEIVDMPPIGDKHNAAVDRLTRWFDRRVGDNAIVRVQGSVRLNYQTEPQPDVILLRWRDDFYASGGAGRDDILLIVEVAHSSLAYDRDVKADLYARNSVPEYWLVDLEARSITVFRGPAATGYRSVTVASGAQPISPLALPDVVLSPNDVIPA